MFYNIYKYPNKNKLHKALKLTVKFKPQDVPLIDGLKLSRQNETQH